MAVSSRFTRKTMAVPTMDIRDICYYELLARNEAMSAVCYLKFVNGVTDRWHCN